MKIAIIGAGNVGGALARALVKQGHAVHVAAKDAKKAAEVAAQIGGGAKGATVAEAASAGDVVILAVPFAAAAEALAAAGDLAGKVLIDATNPFTPDFMGLTVGYSDSAGEQVARLAKGARVVKALNHVFAPNMGGGTFAQAPTAFLAGDDEEAKRVAAGLLESIGLEPVNAGPLKNARHLEPLAGLLIQLGFGQGMGTGIAIKLIRR